MDILYRELNFTSVEKRGILSVKYSVRAPLCCAPHLHSSIELVYFTEGKYSIICDDEEFKAEGGDIALFRSNSIHSMYCQTPKNGHYFVFHLSLSQLVSFVDPYCADFYLYSFSFCRRGVKVFWTREEAVSNGLYEAARRLASFYKSKEFCADIEAKLCFGQIIHIIAKEMGPTAENKENQAVSRSIFDIIGYINRNYNKNITAEECSKRAAMSYSYFSRSFKKTTGKSFKDYLNMVRIAHGEMLLLTTDLPVSQIAAECGFNSQSYFIAEYKRQKNMTPLAYRKAHKI